MAELPSFSPPASESTLQYRTSSVIFLTEQELSHVYGSAYIYIPKYIARLLCATSAGLQHTVIWIPSFHDDVIKWKHFPRYWPFVRGIHRSPVNSPHKGQWRGALMFSLICVWIDSWVNNGEADDLRRYRAHYDVTVMPKIFWFRAEHTWISSAYYSDWNQQVHITILNCSDHQHTKYYLFVLRLKFKLKDAEIIW